MCDHKGRNIGSQKHTLNAAMLKAFQTPYKRNFLVAFRFQPRRIWLTVAPMEKWMKQALIWAGIIFGLLLVFSLMQGPKNDNAREITYTDFLQRV
ncbi:MAG: hypothetical protein DI585_06930, partial [Pseudomonas fluorescens]